MLIRWISNVGHDPVTGGGVGAAVQAIKVMNILKELTNVHYYSLLGYSNSRLIFRAFLDVYQLRFRSYILHSFFSPYSLIIFLLPFKGKILIFPHGEFKYFALKKNRYLKTFFLNLIGFMSSIFKRKTLYFCVTSDEECQVIKDYFSCCEITILPELVRNDIMMRTSHNIGQDFGLHLIFISRLTSNKRIVWFLEEIFKKFKKKFNIFGQYYIKRISVFYISPENSELRRLNALVKKFATQGVDFNIHSGMSKDDISTALTGEMNLIPILPSKFEAFSYTLLEVLSIGYSPIVFFRNRLVDMLEERGLCIVYSENFFNEPDGELSVIAADKTAASSFISDLSDDTVKRYKSCIRSWDLI